MAFGSFNDKAGRSQMHSMADINVTPMVDVMLVLLVIFIIAAPLMTPAIKLDLPQAAAKASQQQPESLQIAIDAAGIIYLQGVQQIWQRWSPASGRQPCNSRNPICNYAPTNPPVTT
jgi:biopolymer transport protein ExbD